MQGSFGDISGPLTTVQSYALGTAGSFNDREALKNNWQSVFYRLVSENTISAASAETKKAQ